MWLLKNIIYVTHIIFFLDALVEDASRLLKPAHRANTCNVSELYSEFYTHVFIHFSAYTVQYILYIKIAYISNTFISKY